MFVVVERVEDHTDCGLNGARYFHDYVDSLAGREH
jgi:hypothetical protein